MDFNTNNIFYAWIKIFSLSMVVYSLNKITGIIVQYFQYGHTQFRLFFVWVFYILIVLSAQKFIVPFLNFNEFVINLVIYSCTIFFIIAKSTYHISATFELCGTHLFLMNMFSQVLCEEIFSAYLTNFRYHLCAFELYYSWHTASVLSPNAIAAWAPMNHLLYANMHPLLGFICHLGWNAAMFYRDVYVSHPETYAALAAERVRYERPIALPWNPQNGEVPPPNIPVAMPVNNVYRYIMLILQSLSLATIGFLTYILYKFHNRITYIERIVLRLKYRCYSYYIVSRDAMRLYRSSMASKLFNFLTKFFLKLQDYEYIYENKYLRLSVVYLFVLLFVVFYGIGKRGFVKKFPGIFNQGPFSNFKGIDQLDLIFSSSLMYSVGFLFVFAQKCYPDMMTKEMSHKIFAYIPFDYCEWYRMGNLRLIKPFLTHFDTLCDKLMLCIREKDLTVLLDQHDTVDVVHDEVMTEYKFANSLHLIERPGESEVRQAETHYNICLKLSERIMEISSTPGACYKKSSVTTMLRMNTDNIEMIAKFIGCNKIRQTPIGFAVIGKPKTCKSWVTSFLSRLILDFNEDPRPIEEARYTKNAGDAYFSGFKRYHSIIYYDDIGSGSADDTLKVLSEFLNIVSPMPYAVNMADIESKGVMEVNPKGLIFTSNYEDYGMAIAKFSNHEAIYRRFIKIIPTPKEEFRDADGKLIPILPENIRTEDLITLRAEEYVGFNAGNKKSIAFKTIFDNLTPKEALPYLQKIIRDRSRDEDAYASEIRSLDIKCPNCHSVLCICVTPQSNTEKFLQVTSLVIFLFSLKYLLEFFSKQEEEEEIVPIEVKENIWQTKSQYIHTYPLNVGCDMKAMLKRLDSASYILESVDKTYSIPIFAVGGQFFLTYRHWFDSIEGIIFNLKHIKSLECGLSPQLKNFEILDKHVWKHPEKDMCIIYLPVPAQTVLLKYFLKQKTYHYTSSDDKIYHIVDNKTMLVSGVNMIVDDLASSPVKDKLFTKENSVVPIFNKGYIYTAETPVFQSGSCGSLCLTQPQVDRVSILGIHTHGTSDIGGYGRIGIGCIVYKEDIIRGTNNLYTDKISPNPLIKDIIIEDVESIDSLHQKSSLQAAVGTAQIMGTISTQNSKNKSKVKPQLFKDAFLKNPDIPEVKLVAPLLYKGYVDGTYRDPFMSNLEYAFDPIKFIPWDILGKAKQDYLERIKRAKYTKTTPLSTYEAINGIDGEPFIKGLDMTTGSGFGFIGTKSAYFTQDSKTNKYYASDVLLKKISNLEETLIAGNIVKPVALACLKDEPVKQKKQFRTRLYCCFPLHYNIVLRKYLLPILSFMQKNNTIFELAVGINCFSKQWSHLYNYLTRKGKVLKKFVAGDYEKFDKKVSIQMLQCVCEIILEIAKLLQYEPKHIRILSLLLQGVVGIMLSVGGDLVQMWSSNPSGQVATAIFNCIINSLYIRIVFFTLGLIQFFLNVRLITYGDDMVLSSLIKEFNHTSIQKVLNSFGIGFTMADKTTKSIPFIHINDVTFLKRRFVIRGNYTFAPLEVSSLSKMTQYRVESNEPPLEVYTSTLISFLIESVQYDNSFFERQYSFVNSLCLDNNLDSVWRVVQPTIDNYLTTNPHLNK